MNSSAIAHEQLPFSSGHNNNAHALSPELQYSLTDPSPSPPSLSKDYQENCTSNGRPELRVITEPGCYIFPLRPSASASTSAVGESSNIPGSPLEASAAPSSTQNSAPPIVYPPPATEQEVEMHCHRRGTGPASGLARSRARTSHSVSPASSSEDLSSPDTMSSPLPSRIGPHPYARIYAKRDTAANKRRKMWNHLLEKSLFTPDELANTGAPSRRPLYISSLEAHIDQLHNRLLELQLYPVSPQSLEEYSGLNCKTVKSMICGLYKDATEERTKLLELKRANNALRDRLSHERTEKPNMSWRHSVDGTNYTYPNLFNGQGPSTIIS